MPKHIESSKIIHCRIPNSKRFNNIKGRKYGRLKVLELYGKRCHTYYWKCICDCGTQAVAIGYSLKNGGTKSCGCLNSEVHSNLMKRMNTTHGSSGIPEYRVWQDMHNRCRRSKSHDFQHYGGRGIKVCARWSKFENFIADMGTRPTALHTIERLDTNEDYLPQNCIWETRKRQSRNKRNNRILNFKGLKMCVADWADKTGISADNIYNRLSMGWSVKRALTQPERHW